MKNTKSAIIGLAVVFLTSGLVYAQPQGANQQDSYAKKGGIFKELNLTQEQQTKLAENRKAQRQEMITLRSTIKDKQTKLQQELKDPAVTKAAVTPLVNDIKSLQAQLIDNRINGIFAVKEILTPEQFAKFQQMAEKHRGEIRGRLQNWREKHKTMVEEQK
jgi:Spy/CpxP family protein refolding chaperone